MNRAEPTAWQHEHYVTNALTAAARALGYSADVSSNSYTGCLTQEANSPSALALAENHLALALALVRARRAEVEQRGTVAALDRVCDRLDAVAVVLERALATAPPVVVSAEDVAAVATARPTEPER